MKQEGVTLGEIERMARNVQSSSPMHLDDNLSRNKGTKTPTPTPRRTCGKATKKATSLDDWARRDNDES